MRIITLTTDFGTRDWFVGAMKGVVLGINPRATVVDITHEVPPGDIRAGAFALMASCRYFPTGTVHVAVVDPGVGGQRRAIAVQTPNACFVGPDNGVLSWALRRERVKQIRLLENEQIFLRPISRTFHGRDVFAPVAAQLSRGLSMARLGRALKDFVRLRWPEPVKRRDEVRGEIVFIDRFGNAITNIKTFRLTEKKAVTCIVSDKRKVRCRFALFYAAVPVNCPVVVPGSSGFFEIALNKGSAASVFGLTVGNGVVLRMS